MATGETVRIAAVADIHCTKTSQGALQPLFTQAAAKADILLLCGDMTDYGLPEEAHVLAHELAAARRMPMIGVLGNHDYESGRHQEVRDILSEAGVVTLDGQSCEVMGIGFAGVKGFAGGFGRGALGLWGEDATKAFVREAINEALKLETALARLRTERRVALLHYAPIQTTVEGEPPSIFPWLGCSRLEEPLTRYPVDAVFHGHAHHGRPEGHIRDSTPVYNVSMPLLRATFPDRPPFRVLELSVSQAHDQNRDSEVRPAIA